MKPVSIVGRLEAPAAPQGPSRPGNGPSVTSPASEDAIPASLAASIPKPGTWKRTREQGVQLARMGVNEDSRSLRRLPGGTEGKPTIDHRLIAQTVLNRRRAKSTFTGWLDVMKWLSPHVGKVKESKRHRHEVNAHLPANGGDPPPQWIDCRDVDEGEDCDGDWRVHGPYWVETRERIVDLWLTADFDRYPVKPVQWGNDDDVIRFLKRKGETHCVLGIGERNFFVARDGDGCSVDDEATMAAREGKRP